MPTSLIVYFSQGGTTARIAEAVAQGLRTAKYEVDLCDIREAHHKDVSTYDLLGIGSPTYYFRPPFNVMDYVHGLPRLTGRSFFVFIVYGTYCGDSGNMIRHALVQQGAREVGYFQSRGADYFLGYLKQGYLFSPDHPRAEDLSRAGLFGQEVAAHHAGKPIIRPEEDRRPAMIHRIERSLVSRRLVRQIYSRLLRVNEKACTACGLCMRLCPTGNIRENKEGHPRWGRNCLLCFTCEMKCPKGAIASTATWLLFKPFMIYNTLDASRDPLLDHVRVIHQNGHTRRI
jgi:flavodoxin/Pyruvate/2-oxoacid:ferredoxin oxidoreductase delta subunit